MLVSRAAGGILRGGCADARLDLVWGVVLDVKWWATTLQFIGALIASGGLLLAYARAARFREEKWPRIQDRVRKISYALGRRRPVITGSGDMTLQPLQATLGLEGFPPFVRIRNPTPEERFKALEDVVNRLINQDIPPVLKDIKDLKAEVAAARSLAESAAEKALSECAQADRGAAAGHRSHPDTRPPLGHPRPGPLGHRDRAAVLGVIHTSRATPGQTSGSCWVIKLQCRRGPRRVPQPAMPGR